MRKKKAIKILEEQRQKVLNPHYQNNQEWIFETASYIKNFFGVKSAEYAWISQFKWYVKSGNTAVVSTEEIHEILGKKSKKMVLFLNNCKLILENKGLYKIPKNNVLSNISNGISLRYKDPLLSNKRGHIDFDLINNGTQATFRLRNTSGVRFKPEELNEDPEFFNAKTFGIYFN